MQYQIRNYKPADYTELKELWHSTGLDGKERKDNEIVINRTLERGGKLLIMEHSGRIIGSAWITNDGRRMHLHHFCIDAQYRGKKLSINLMQEVFNHAKEVGYQLKLEVHKDNLVAINLYKKFKFTVFDDYLSMVLRTF